MKDILTNKIKLSKHLSFGQKGCFSSLAWSLNDLSLGTKHILELLISHFSCFQHFLSPVAIGLTSSNLPVSESHPNCCLCGRRQSVPTQKAGSSIIKKSICWACPKSDPLGPCLDFQVLVITSKTCGSQQKNKKKSLSRISWLWLAKLRLRHCKPVTTLLCDRFVVLSNCKLKKKKVTVRVTASRTSGNSVTLSNSVTPSNLSLFTQSLNTPGLKE